MQNLKSLKQITENLSVLYVEDDENIASSFKNYLQKFFNKIDYKENGEEGLNCFLENQHDIVITDIRMPKMDGLEMSEKIKQINPNQNILITSAYTNVAQFLQSIKIGIDGYIIKPIDYDNLNSMLYKISEKIKTYKDLESYKKNLEKLVKIKTQENTKLELEKIENYEKTLFALIDIIENRDPYTGKHSLRVAEYSKLIAEELGFDKDECEELYKAGILHDIGKIAIPDSLLLKPSKLNDNEYKLIQEHVSIGVHMLEQIPMFKEISEIINCHHERLDGSGYPNKLKGEEIPFKANIMALADSFDAMTTNRIYKGRKSIKEALEEISSLKNIYFKEKIVKAAEKVLKNIVIDNNISQLPKTTLEKERFSYFYKDTLTRLFNERYLDFILSKNKNEKEYSELYIVFLDDFSKYNKSFGWSVGNQLLIDIANKLNKIYDGNIIFRMHGDDFVILASQNYNFDIIKFEELKLFISEYSKDIIISYKKFDIKENLIYSISKLENLI
ncbi:MAG: histidine kinase [Arcobacter sp.]|nr:MAG: histidine kinase [Arcobacter sp.]